MESKNVKIIDEHGIDREASIICSIDVDGSDYVVYWIERDSENDNIFVSKILKNNDGTSNMVNIEDAGEKSRVSDIVKGIITYAINNEADKLVGASVTLPNGHNVGISSVLINKEQNINVQKTYITTVKKSVTKVSETFYVVEKPEIVEPVVLPIFEDVVAPAEVVEVKDEVATIQPVVSTPVEVVSESETIVPEVKVETPTLEVSQPEVSVLPVSEQTIVVPEPIVAPTPVVPISSVETVNPESSVEPEIVPSEVVVPTPVENKVVFDASKETNLNVALGEASAEAPVSVNNVEPIRDFGVEEPVVASTEPEKIVETTSNTNGGFAHNKFFMVVAIMFFVASCVFLGYEVFQYFQIK